MDKAVNKVAEVGFIRLFKTRFRGTCFVSLFYFIFFFFAKIKAKKRILTFIDKTLATQNKKHLHSPPNVRTESSLCYLK